MISPWQKYLLWADHNTLRVCADHLEDWPEAMLRWFEEHGLLCPAATLEALDCSECPDAPFRDIHWRENAESGVREPVLRCPSCGPVRIDPDRLRCWTIDVTALARQVAYRCGLRGDVESVVPQRLWRLGKAHWAGRPTTVFLGRALCGRDVASVLASVEQSTSAVLLVLGREPVMSLKNPVSPLSLVISWDGDTLVADSEFAIAQARPAAQAAPTHPLPRGGIRSVMAERLRTELEAHLRSAGEHIRFALDSGRDPAPFPCPAQREFATRLGTSPATITRILESNCELRKLFDLAQDPLAVLGALEG